VRSFCEFNIETGHLVQRGRCENQCVPRMRDGSAIAFISTSSTADRITSADIDSEGVAVNPVLHRASKAEKENRRNRVLEPRRLFPGHGSDDMPAHITNKQLQDMLAEIGDLREQVTELQKLL